MGSLVRYKEWGHELFHSLDEFIELQTRVSNVVYDRSLDGDTLSTFL